MSTKLSEPKPGEVLQLEFLEPMEISQYKLAKAVGVPHSRITRLVKGEVAVTVDTALRFARYFGTTAQFWLNLQNNYDLRTVGEEKKSEIEHIQPVSAA
ncbi:addiction module antidote protein, HigA family [Rubritalea squalenifaciens DSM 18772]|uniref:Addiction module antidote protein, HigA family n=1 Tax=Rubritalea squalenifaciens DSM 18772 TaxID=1123071 RepID=A0A1M6KXK0_9BACT|nr:HigA family addiction module antitoxin [Rubritalea squalenifaciens]SHJ63687.1 addiction module antidote protein, HigA family [Rubritalea squalenifaciens DSM 18772]